MKEFILPRFPVILLLLLLLLLISYTCGCFAAVEPHHFISFGESEKMTVNIVREVPKKGQGSLQAFTVAASDAAGENKKKKKCWAPIRIVVSAEDLKSGNERYCEDTAGNKKRPNFQGDNVTCTSWNVFDTTKNNTLLNDLLPAAIKLHVERLSVQSVVGPLKIPKPENGNCTHFTIPESHTTEGVNNSDFILYIAAGPGETFSEECGEDNETQRPTSGVMNIRPEIIINDRYNIRIAAHHIAHALGFTHARMQRHNMLLSKSVRGKPQSLQVNTTKVKEAAKKHYNCPSLTGMELEDEGQFANSHWERRNAKDELMSTYDWMAVSGALLYTALTMAFFEDLGFYKAHWGMEEKMTWGNQSGCNLLNKKCIENGKSNYENMFCTENSFSIRKCTSDRYALGNCIVVDNAGQENLPSYFQYFSNGKQGGPKDVLTDRCPIIIAGPPDACSNSGASASWGILGPQSRCVTGESIKVERGKEHLTFRISLDVESVPAVGIGALTAEVLQEDDEGVGIGDVCTNVKCEDGKVKVQIKGEEKEDKWYICNKSGEKIYVTGIGVFKSGHILCPSFEEICTDVKEASTEISQRIPTDKCEEEEATDTETAAPDINTDPDTDIKTKRENITNANTTQTKGPQSPSRSGNSSVITPATPTNPTKSSVSPQGRSAQESQNNKGSKTATSSTVSDTTNTGKEGGSTTATQINETNEKHVEGKISGDSSTIQFISTFLLFTVIVVYMILVA